MKSNIFEEFAAFVLKKLNPKEIFFSPYKKNALLIYNGDEVYNNVCFCDFSVLFKENNSIFEVSSSGYRVYCWYSQDSVFWSGDSRFCAVSVSINNKEDEFWFKEAKVLIDINSKLFTLIPLAGAREYKVKIEKNIIEISTRKVDGNKEYIEILSKRTNLSNFKWLPLSSFYKVHKLFNTGYFGNLVGYKVSARNVYFEVAKNEWPYENIVVGQIG